MPAAGTHYSEHLCNAKNFTPKAEDRFLGPLMTCGFLVDHITFLQLPHLAQAGPPQSYIRRVVIETQGFLGPESNQSRWQFTFQWNQEGQSHVYQRMNGANHLDICRWIARLYRNYVFSFRLHLFYGSQQPNVVPASAHLPLHGTDFIFSPFWSQALLHSKS
jgi:hypothetical protein